MTTELVSPTHLPDGYRQVLYWKLSEHKMLLVFLNAAGLVLMGVVGALLWAWARLWRPATLRVDVGMAEMAMMIAGLLSTIVLHEWMHGIALRCYGARPRYGVMWKEMMFYATAPGHDFRRNHYLVIALAPLVGLSLLGLLLLALPFPGWLVWTVVMCTALNAGSAVGDLWLVRVALTYPPMAFIVDERDGLRVFMPAGGA